MHWGTAVPWLGCTIASPLGCIWVPPAKILRAVGQIRSVQAGELAAADYRKLFGFLVSLLFMVGDDDTLMHELEQPLRANGELARGPATVVSASGAMRRALARWNETLLNFSGASILAALAPQPRATGAVVWRPRSDAAREPLAADGAATDGMGGALYHIWWRIELTEALRRLPIAVLEFIAKGINSITFDAHIPEAADIAEEVDAKATVEAVSNRAHAEMMRVVLEELTAHPSYARRLQAPGVHSIEHIYGAGNLMADAASRGHEEVINELCAALGLTATRIDPPPDAHAFLQRVLDRLRHHQGAPLPESEESRKRKRRAETAHAAHKPQAPRADPMIPAATALEEGNSSNNLRDGPGDGAGENISQRLLRVGRGRTTAEPFTPTFEATRPRKRRQSAPAASGRAATSSSEERGPSAGPTPLPPRAPPVEPARRVANRPLQRGTPASSNGSASPAAVAPLPAALGSTAFAMAAAPPAAPRLAPSPARTEAGAAPPVHPPATPKVTAAPAGPSGSTGAPLAQVRTAPHRPASAAVSSGDGNRHPYLHRHPPSPSERGRAAASPGSGCSAAPLPQVGPSPVPAARATARGTGVAALTSLMLLSGATTGAVMVGGGDSIHPALKQHQEERAHAIFAALRDDSSAQRISAHDERMLEMCERMVEALDSNDGELQGNAKSNWKHWVGFCSWAGILPWRTDPRAALGTDAGARLREQTIWVNALLYIWPRMRNAPGRDTPPKPQSALAILRGIKKMHRDLGYEVIPLTPVVQAMRKLLERYRDKHGPEALQPHRKEPLTNELIIALIATTRADDTLSAGDRLMWVGLWNLLAQTGMRKAEVALPAGAAFGLKHFSWDNVKWRVGGTDYAALTPALRARLKEGDMLIVRPPPSKADPFGLRWGVHPIYLPYSATAPINAARAMADLEMHRNPAGRRIGTQVFALDGGVLRRAAVDDAFKAWIRLPHVAGPEAGRRHSVHSFRSYLATALATQGASNARIQAMLRWASDDAVLIYNRTQPETYALWVGAAAGADINSIVTHHLPRERRWAGGGVCDGGRASGIRVDSDELVAEASGQIDILAAIAEAGDD
jgi:integrase